MMQRQGEISIATALLFIIIIPAAVLVGFLFMPIITLILFIAGGGFLSWKVCRWLFDR